MRLKLKPQAKKPAFFSLATPVGVKGTIDAPEIDISIWEVTKSVGRFLVSIVVVPVKRIFVDPLPPDGTADMLEDMRRAIDGILQESRAGEVLDSAAAPFADAVPLTRPESSP